MKNSTLAGSFAECYGSSPTLIVAAPGRINLIGEHTDYNQGLVMPAAIDKCMYFASRKTDGQQADIYAYDLDQRATFDIDANAKDPRSWVHYCKGIIATLLAKGYTLGGFQILLTSDIPIGAGLSSSAALDCGLLKSLDELFHLGLSDWDIVLIANESNNNYVGIPSGILDQFACTFGRSGHCMIMNCENQHFEYVPAILTDYQIVLIDTKVQHDHLSSGYNEGPEQCREALHIIQQRHPSISSLSQCTPELLLSEQATMPAHLWARVSYIVTENKRVQAFGEAFRSRDVETLGSLLYATHEGLSTLYRVSCRELDLLVEYSRQEPAVAGSRMMGGGFGGCTISIIKKGSEAVIDSICSKYQLATGIQPEVYYTKISDGLRTL